MIIRSTLCFLLTITCITAYSQLYINEWMASNSSIISDPDFDNSGDWIEIFNDYNVEVDLGGYFLTDNFNNPTKWTFPEGTLIQGNAHLLIWADGENIGNHANFKLTKDAEEIGLSNLDTILIDHISYVNHKTNISQGRNTDGSSIISFFIDPTPGESNTTTAYEGITFYEPHFDVKGGIYTSSVEIAMKAIEGTIKYTTDGSEPNLSSSTYTSPIQVSETTVLRARILNENFIPGKIKTNTYFINELKNIKNLPVISISSNPENFWDPAIGIYVQDFKPEWEYPINIELFENDGSDRAAFNELAGTKVNGLNAWVLPQKMLGIYFDNDYDNNNLEYQLFYNKKRKKYDNFTLRASGSDWGNTLFRDALCQDLTDGYMDLEHMDYKPAVAFINGEYMGIHNMRSRIDEGFIEENFGLLASEYDLIENNGYVEQGDNTSFKELFALFENDMSNLSNYQEVSELMDIENMTDYFIAQIWSSNSSWGHNIQMWKPKNNTTKWRWIMQDFDRGFVGRNDNLIDSYSTEVNPAGYNWARLPLKALLGNDDFSKQFASKFTTHLYTTYHPTRVINKINEYANYIAPNIPNHVDKWAGTTSVYGNGLPSVSYWEEEVDELRLFANQRRGNLITDIKSTFSLSGPVTLNVINLSNTDSYVTINELKIPDDIWTGPYFPDMPFELEAVVSPGEDFIGWTTAKFKPLIDSPSEWKYLDSGLDLGQDWKTLDFNDNNWSNGLSELGYGDQDENTEVSYGGNPDEKFITTYFRKRIQIDNISEDAGSMILELLADDGAVVYINGHEVVRYNMPSGVISSQTQASSTLANPEEYTFYQHLILSESLIQGINIIAVEVHQSGKTSSDISFDLRLKWLTTPSNQYISTEPKITVNLSTDSSLVANYISNNSCVLRGVISENTTLIKDCSPYLVTSDVIVSSGISLNIEEGVELKFSSKTNLTVLGDLQVLGTESNPIIFSSIYSDEDWGSIILKNGTAKSILNWTEIIGASNGPHPVYENAAISVFNSAIELDHITIVDVANNPILAYYSDVDMTNSLLNSKVTGDLINVKYGSASVINCTFEGNKEIDTDAIDYDEVIDGIIKGNKITNFLGFNSDGIDIGEESKNILIQDNFIHNCTDKGVSAGQQSSLLVTNNTIANCDKGIAIKDESSAIIDQTTFYNVTTPVAAFEKNIGIGGGIAFITNSILSNSAGQSIEYDDNSYIDASYNLSDTDTILGEFNIEGHPQFIAPSNYDFNLLNTSNAINAGVNDSGMAIDLGSKFVDSQAEPLLMISAINYAPLENIDAEFIEIYNASLESINIQDYTISNAVDFIFPIYIITSGETIRIALNSSLQSSSDKTIFQWTRGRLSNGGEKIRLTSKYGIVLDQVTYDNKSPWPSEADGQGSYLSLISPDLDNHHSESWIAQLSTKTNDPSDIEYDIELFPNPTSGILNIRSKTPFSRIDICNSLGLALKSQQINNNLETKIDISGLITGNYFVKIDGRWIKTIVLIN